MPQDLIIVTTKMEYDLVIIGAGWAGFNACLTARKLNLKVALIEERDIGGTCLNRGCIPTKALLQSAKIFSLAKKSKTFGINIQEPQADFAQIQARKDKIVQQLKSGMEFMLKGMDIYRARGRIRDKNTVDAGKKQIKARFILIATGSKPFELKNLKFDRQKILSSDDILSLSEIPKSLLIVGGGVIGCEFATLFSAFGTQISIVEKMPQLLPGEDKEIAKKIEISFKKRGIKILANTDATTIDLTNYERVLLSIGRIPQIQDIGLEESSIALERGRIGIGPHLQTNVENIFAAGDCTGRIILAHFAAYQGRIAAANIASSDKKTEAFYADIPNCIFTDPEIASVGLNEDTALAQGIDMQIHKFDFLGSGMARILDETEGFIKIISDQKSGGIIGSSIIGPKATELIGILTTAVQTHLTLAQLKNIIFAHPTLSESISDAVSDIKAH